ncbi:endonuclease/exonuclease/phosphatase family protein [Campylobacter gastrosuis]|uniref:Endonuclease/exonuclease/phosphatase domain-containing protein n=1 Tax=Campylobacter gastrosuis TaxID=2974576 RepID=A0ABT7HPR6_9BACT|nr:endonuclease/exonuclease/phosphatase family protein [Campylobacter gastrosuis]MDL0088608.1 hypothetical protein [Campylobacter gastrosuis]
MRAIFFTLIFCVFAISDTLKIATYNVENLFDDKLNGNEYKDFKTGWGRAEYENKLKNIKFAINAINADIIALEEIENEAVLKDLIKGTDYKFTSFCSPFNSPVGLGIISKIKPSSKPQCIGVKGVKTRDILRQEFSLNGKKFSIFVNHFPAFKNGLAVQEKTARVLFDALNSQNYAIALGDFNTPFGKKNVLTPIEINQKFTNLWRELEPKERFSFVGYGKKRAIDHVLLSPDFFNGELFYVCKSFGVFKDGLVDENNEAKVDENGKNLYSDHLPLIFEISDEKSKACGFFSRF